MKSRLMVVAGRAALFAAGGVFAQQKLKFAHVYETSEPYHTAAVWAAGEIAKRTSNRYTVEVFPASSLGKETDINQGLTELALEIEGAYAPLSRGDEHAVAGGAWQYSFLRSRANSIEGGTTDILKNIIAERVLGLPRLR